MKSLWLLRLKTANDWSTAAQLFATASERLSSNDFCALVDSVARGHYPEIVRTVAVEIQATAATLH